MSSAVARRPQRAQAYRGGRFTVADFAKTRSFRSWFTHDTSRGGRCQGCFRPVDLLECFPPTEGGNVARNTSKGLARLEQRQAAFDASKRSDGHKRPGSTNAHKGLRRKSRRR